MRIRPLLLLVLISLVAPAGAHADEGAHGSIADSLPIRSYVTNGVVQTVVRAGNTIYIGGRFNRLGPRTGPGVEFGLDGSQSSGLPEVTGGGGAVQAVVSDGIGGWYIAGLFTHVGGIARSNIAHVRADRVVDLDFDPNANDGIHAMALSGSTLYVAGLFTSIGGQARNRIAALNAVDGKATAFDPDADAAVETLAVSSSVVYAGGRFTTIGGLPRSNIAALNSADGSAVPTFNPTSDGIVLSMALSGATLYVGGFFKAIGGAVRGNIAALNAGGPLDGTAIPTFDPNANAGSTIPGAGGVEALAVSHSGDTVYAGGLFTNIGGQSRRYLAALHSSDGTATAFTPNPNGNVLGLSVSDDDTLVYAAGGFNSYDGLPSIGGQVRNYLATLNAADGSANTFNPAAPNSAAVAIGVSSSAIYVGGAFSSVGGLVRNGIAALNAADGTPTSFNPNATWGSGNATVNAIAVSGSTVYVGGFFTGLGGAPRNYLGAVNADDGTATAWNPASNSIIETLVVSGSIIYAGGEFTSLGGQSRNFVGALRLDDGTATDFDPNANSTVQTIAVAGDVVYVGGYFTTIAGQTRNKIAALRAADGSATSWDPDATSQANVLTLAVAGSTIYAGGDFTTIGGEARTNIAALRAADGRATDFDPQANAGVFSLAVSGSGVYAGGFFDTIGGKHRDVLAELNPIDGTATSFDPGADPGFGAFAMTVAPDGTLYVGGSFRTFDLAFQQSIVSFAGPPLSRPPTASVSANPTSGVARLTVAFDASTSTDPDGAETIEGYTFDFGDGSPQVTQSSATTSHIYTAAGAYTARVTVTDNRGLPSVNTASIAITVSPPDPVLPPSPAIAVPEDRAMLNASSVTIAGTTEPGLTVKIFEGSNLLGTRSADSSGKYAIVHGFSDGVHAITATASDTDGNTSAISEARTFTVDTVAPAAPVIVSPGAGAHAADSSVVLSGTAEARAIVTLREGSNVVARVLADGNGAWGARVGLTNGAHLVTATATDVARNAGPASAPRSFNVADSIAPVAPTFIEPAHDARLGTSEVVVAGTAEPEAFVRIADSDTDVVSAAADDMGNWRAIVTLSEGTHSLSARAVDPAGNVGAPGDPVNFEITLAPDTNIPAIATPGVDSVQPKNMTITGTASVPHGTPLVVREGPVVIASTVVGYDGQWSAQLTLENGLHAVTAAIGNSVSALRRFEVDASSPSVTIATASPALFVLTAPAIGGTATDNAGVAAIELRYYQGSARVLTQMAECDCGAGAGDITWEARPALPTGSYSVQVNAIDRAGNRSGVRTISFIVI